MRTLIGVFYLSAARFSAQDIFNAGFNAANF
jgi:hypothetical protein